MTRCSYSSLQSTIYICTDLKCKHREYPRKVKNDRCPPEVQPVPASRSDEQVLPANHSPPNRRNPLSESPPFRFVFFGLEPPFPRVGLPVGPPALTVFASEHTEVSSALSGQFIRTNAIYYCKLRHFSSSASVFGFILF